MKQSTVAAICCLLGGWLLLSSGDRVPPDPTPDPAPDVDPTPIVEDGKRVLIIYESADLSKYPYSQTLIFQGAVIRDYLRENCSKGEDGTPEFRIWDQDVDTSHVSEIWQKAMEIDRKSLPWLIVSNGVSGTSCPLPETAAATMEILDRYLK